MTACVISKLPRTPNWCALTQYRPLNFALLDAIMLLKMWLDPGAPLQLAGLNIPPICSQLVHSLSIVYPLKLIRVGSGTRFRGMRSLTFAACGKKNSIIFTTSPLAKSWIRACINKSSISYIIAPPPPSCVLLSDILQN